MRDVVTADLTPLDVLRHAGWCKGEGRSKDGRFCTLGAVRFVADTADNEQSPLELLVIEVVKEQYPDRTTWIDTITEFGKVAAFNDHPDTTFADVELVLEKAQARYDEQPAL